MKNEDYRKTKSRKYEQGCVVNLSLSKLHKGQC